MTREDDIHIIGATRSVQRSPISGDGFEIIVVFTRAGSTLRALKRAGGLAEGLGASIRLLAPHIIPYPVPLEERLIGTVCLERRFQTLVGGNKVETRVDTRLCRNRWQMLQCLLPPGSAIVLGGSNRHWSAESRLARKLQAAGHHVVFVPDPD